MVIGPAVIIWTMIFSGFRRRLVRCAFRGPLVLLPVLALHTVQFDPWHPAVLPLRAFIVTVTKKIQIGCPSLVRKKRH